MNENSNFVPININPPIEIFWMCLAQKVYERGWKAKKMDQLICRIESKKELLNLIQFFWRE